MGRVLYLYAQVYRAGSPHGRAAVQMLSLIRAAGLEADLLTFPGGDPWPQGLVRHLYHTARVPFARTLPPYGSGLRRWWATLVLTLAALRLFVHRRYDAVHCADRSVRVGGLVAWVFGARFIFEWHTASGHDLVRWLRRRPKRFLRAVSLVLSDVPYPFARLRETGLYGRIATVPALPDPAIVRRPPPPPRLHGAAQPFRLTAFMSETGVEGLAALCDALPDLLTHANFRVRIACGTPAAGERIRAALARHLPDASAMEIRPEPCDAEELGACVADADLVFLPLAHGILPPTRLLDVIAACRPLLAIRCPAYETLLNDANACLVPPNAQAITAAVCRHLLAPLLCADHALAALETLERDRTFSAVAAEFRACYTFALSESRP